jgi:hypothetical protein
MSKCGSNPHGPVARRPSQALCAPSLGPSHKSPVLLKKFQIALRLRSLTFSGSKKKDPRQICLSVAKASHSHSTWAEVSSAAPYFLHKGLSKSPIMWRCLLRVLCPVRRPITALDCALLKDISAVLAAVLGPEINSWVCLIVPTSPRQRTGHTYIVKNSIKLNFIREASSGLLWNHWRKPFVYGTAGFTAVAVLYLFYLLHERLRVLTWILERRT